MPRTYTTTPPEERFWGKVNLLAPNGCWEWTKCLNKDGYGRFMVVKGTVVLAHVWAWEWLNQPVPDGMELDHLCRNHSCVNPAHLEPVTHRENMRRGYWATKTECDQGHAYTEENTYIRRDGTRDCRACNRERGRRHAKRAKART